MYAVVYGDNMVLSEAYGVLQVVNSVDDETIKLYSINLNYYPLQYNIFVDPTKPKFPPSKFQVD